MHSVAGTPGCAARRRIARCASGRGRLRRLLPGRRRRRGDHARGVRGVRARGRRPDQDHRLRPGGRRVRGRVPRPDDPRPRRAHPAGHEGLVAAALDRPPAAVLRRRGRGPGPPGLPGRLAGARTTATWSSPRACGSATATTVDAPVLPGEVLVVEGRPTPRRTALLLTLAGRMRLRRSGRAKVAGLVLPEQAGRSASRTGYLDCADGTDLRRELRATSPGRSRTSLPRPRRRAHRPRRSAPRWPACIDDLVAQAHEQPRGPRRRAPAAIADLVRGPCQRHLRRCDDRLGALDPPEPTQTPRRPSPNKETRMFSLERADGSRRVGSLVARRAAARPAGPGRRLPRGPPGTPTTASTGCRPRSSTSTSR